MRRGSKIALLAVLGCGLVVVSAAGAFLFGHDVGTRERLAINNAMRSRELSSLAANNMTKRAFQGWSLVCRDWTGGERRCVLFIAVADPESKQVLLTFSVSRTPQGKPVLIVDTPAGVAVDQSVTVTAGEAQSVKVPIQSCGPQRCRAIAVLDESLQAALEAADLTSITYVRANNQQSTYNLPTRGFREGIAAWLAESGRSAQTSATAAVN
jgi:invasion protein IalB